jgi:hypothetical protein
MHGHTALGPGHAVPVQQLHRHGVQHLVAHHHALQRVGQGVQPLHAAAERGQALRLALAQRAGQVDDTVAAHLHRPAHPLAVLRGQRARAGAELHHLVQAAGVQRLRHLARQRAAEQR